MSTIPKDGITFEELVNRIQNEELIEQINHVLEVRETSVELAHRQQLIKILYEAVCKLIDGYQLATDGGGSPTAPLSMDEVLMKQLETSTILKLDEMCIASLPPELFEQWGKIKVELIKNRKL